MSNDPNPYLLGPQIDIPYRNICCFDHWYFGNWLLYVICYLLFDA